MIVKRVRLIADLLVYGFILAAILFVLPKKSFAACNIINGHAYGDCKGITINQDSKGYLSVTNSVFESGIISGATVHRGGVLELSGVSNGNIVVEKGGTLTVTGVVNGDIINKGGYIVVDGSAQLIKMTGGTVEIGGIVDRVSGNGLIKYRKGAVVGGIPHN
jgi:hypothetical protein